MITLNWKACEVAGLTYYEQRILAINSRHVVNGIADHEFIFHVKRGGMDEQADEALIQRLANLFPELNLAQIKKAIQP